MGRSGMSDLSASVRRYIGSVAAFALVSCFVAVLLQPPTARDAILGVVFGASIALAWLFPISISYRKKLYVDAAPAFAALLTMSAGAAMAVVGGVVLLAYALRRERGDPIEAVYNAGQATLAAGCAVVALHLLDWHPGSSGFEEPASLAAFGLASGVMFLANSGLLAGVIGLQTGESVNRVWARSVLREDPIEIAAHLSLTGVGVIAAFLVSAHPWTLILLVPPVVSMLGALRHHGHLRAQAEQALRGSLADLAEAQRIARLGSWDWDVLLDGLVWSDQVFRILGVAPGEFPPSLDAFLGRVHPGDRERFKTTLADALDDVCPFSIDHRIVLPDGSSRTVHSQGEVIRDPHGRPARMVGTILDITERKALEAQLAHRAFHDALTDLPNRALFADRLERALDPTGDPKQTVAVLFLDLDDFKLVNDGIGHDAGDRLLVAVAERLRGALDERHLAARFGGDEFTVLLEGLAGPEEAVAVAEHLVRGLSEPFALDGHEVVIAASVGVAHGRAGQDHALALLRDADAALYEAKAGGKHGVALFRPGMIDEAIRRLDLKADLRRALERGEMRLLYQPVIEFATGGIVGVEALIRWQHPVHGLLAPERFLPLAEETGLALPLGEWVLRTACRDAAAWRRLAPTTDGLRIAVNLSVRQLRQPGLAELMAGTLREAGLPAAQLELEITEQVVTQDLRAVAAVIEDLRRGGVRLSLDDVGGGSSSLGHFQHLTFDALKLDRTFLAGLVENDRQRAIVEAVIGLAKVLGIEVTAEGIETTDDLLVARALGCRYGQGFRFAGPMPAAEIETLIEHGLPFDIAYGRPLDPVRQAWPAGEGVAVIAR